MADWGEDGAFLDAVTQLAAPIDALARGRCRLSAAGDRTHGTAAAAQNESDSRIAPRMGRVDTLAPPRKQRDFGAGLHACVSSGTSV